MPPIDDWAGGFDRTDSSRLSDVSSSSSDYEADQGGADEAAHRLAQEMTVLLDWIAEDVTVSPTPGSGHRSSAPYRPNRDWAAGRLVNNGTTIVISQLELPCLSSWARQYGQLG